MLILATAARAQDESPWKLSGMIGLNLNLTNHSRNWSGDETDASSWMLKFEFTAERDGTRTNWLTTLKDDFGKAKQGDNPEKKSADLVFFDSILGLKTSMSLKPFVSLNIQTQNDELFDPAKFTESVGVAWDIVTQERQNFKTRLGAAFRQIYDPVDLVKDETTGELIDVTSTDDPDTPEIEEWQHDVGAEWVTNYDVLFGENSKFTTEVRVFSAFNGGADLRWDNSLYIKLASVFTMQLGYLVVYEYDEHIKPIWPNDIETRLTLAFGVSYNIF
jgi:hypothetical protein